MNDHRVADLLYPLGYGAYIVSGKKLVKIEAEKVLEGDCLFFPFKDSKIQ